MRLNLFLLLLFIYFPSRNLLHFIQQLFHQLQSRPLWVLLKCSFKSRLSFVIVYTSLTINWSQSTQPPPTPLPTSPTSTCSVTTGANLGSLCPDSNDACCFKNGSFKCESNCSSCQLGWTDVKCCSSGGCSDPSKPFCCKESSSGPFSCRSAAQGCVAALFV
jgi:hypothetical protein